MRLIKDNLDRIVATCQKHQVDKLYIFGSVLSETFSSKSDIDFLVRFGPISLGNYFDNYLQLKNDLNSILQRPVDLVEEQTLKNPVLIKSIRANQQLIYG